MPHDGDHAPPLTHMVCQADEMAIRDALAGIRQKWQAEGLDVATCATGEQVLAEVLNNVVEHAQAGRCSGRIELETVINARELICKVRDDGLAMPDNSLPVGHPADVTRQIDDLPEGGFGWFMIRSLTNELVYERTDKWNRLYFRIARPTA